MKRLLLTAGLALPHLLFAQAPSGVSLDRDRLLVGETVTVVVNFEAATRWCGLRVDLGDGDVRDVKVEDFPLTLTKQYASAGRYVVRATGRAVPRGLLSVLPCTGRARTAVLEVNSARRDASPPPRQGDLAPSPARPAAEAGRDASRPPRQGDSDDRGVDPKEIEKRERERQKHAEKREREQRKQERKREQKDEREREERIQAEQRERARRAGEAAHRPPAREPASTAVPVPARPRAPAPAASKPLDGSLKVF